MEKDQLTFAIIGCAMRKTFITYNIVKLTKEEKLWELKQDQKGLLHQ
jgi:hypothetical protein